MSQTRTHVQTRPLNTPESRSRFAEWGVTPDFKGPVAYTAYVKAEMDKWRSIIVSSGAQID